MKCASSFNWMLRLLPLKTPRAYSSKSFCPGQRLASGLPQSCAPICRSGVSAPVGCERSMVRMVVSGVVCSTPNGAFHCPTLKLASGKRCQFRKMSVPENPVRLLLMPSPCSKSPSNLKSKSSRKSPLTLMRARRKKNRLWIGATVVLSGKTPNMLPASPNSALAWIKPPSLNLASLPHGRTKGEGLASLASFSISVVSSWASCSVKTPFCTSLLTKASFDCAWMFAPHSSGASAPMTIAL